MPFNTLQDLVTTVEGLETSVDTLQTKVDEQKSFSTISVQGQTSVVADGASDTLTLVAGTNVSITTDATTDTINIGTPEQTGPITFNHSKNVMFNTNVNVSKNLLASSGGY